jgi:hypothetical protein
MWDLFVRAVWWLLLIFFGSQAIIFVAVVLWTLWNGVIKLWPIPADDVERLADDLIASFPDPEHETAARHERAWHCSDDAEQTLWYRVRKAVRRRLGRR